MTVLGLAERSRSGRIFQVPSETGPTTVPPPSEAIELNSLLSAPTATPSGTARPLATESPRKITRDSPGPGGASSVERPDPAGTSADDAEQAVVSSARPAA